MAASSRARWRTCAPDDLPPPGSEATPSRIPTCPLAGNDTAGSSVHHPVLRREPAAVNVISISRWRVNFDEARFDAKAIPKVSVLGRCPSRPEAVHSPQCIEPDRRAGRGKPPTLSLETIRVKIFVVRRLQCRRLDLDMFPFGSDGESGAGNESGGTETACGIVQRRQGPRGPQVVAVEEGDIVAGRVADACVAGRRHPAVAVMPKDHNLGSLGVCRCGTPAGGPVVNDDDLVGPLRLRHHALDGRRQRGRSVVRRDDYQEFQWPISALPNSSP